MIVSLGDICVLEIFRSSVETWCLFSCWRVAAYPEGTVFVRMTALSSRVDTRPAVRQVKPV